MKKVGYLGIPGSYSHTAATVYFSGDSSMEFVGSDSFLSIFDSVRSGALQKGIIPIENTLAGSIYENYDYFEDSSLHVIGEIYLKIEHNLLVGKEIIDKYRDDPKTVRTVYSHPKAIEQCSQFLHAHPWITTEVASDTANAARVVSESHEKFAAIANSQCAELYGLEIADASIENNSENYTRFLVISKQQYNIRDADKASLSVYMPHKKGSLYKTLGILLEENCNLTKIESRPLVGKPFEYIFYFDFQYDPAKQDLDIIMNRLKVVTSKIELIGVYKSGKI